MHDKQAVNVGQIASQIGQGALRFGKTMGGIPGDLGNVALTAGRKGLNALGGLGGVQGVGNATVGAAQKAVGNMAGVGRMSKFNPLNMATGGGIIGGGATALHRAITGGGGGGAASPAPAASPAGGGGVGGLGGFSQRAQQMWSSLPVEARYAIGAGVPLALLGGLTGRKGLGALGLGAAALGGAAGGAFGDGARRMVGKGMYNVGSFFGGGGNDHASQLNMLGKLSPGLGATVLMGRDKNLSSEDAQKQYEFLTKNKDIISKMLPQLTAKSASYLVGTVLLDEEEKQSRCWKGYEPVPGSKAYSRGSCRPAGSKKTQKEMKKSSVNEAQDQPKQKPCCDAANVPEHEATEKTKQIKPKNTETKHDESVITGDLGQKASASQLFHQISKKLEAVIDNKVPSSEGKHVSIVHHDMDVDDGVDMKPEEAEMHPDMKAVPD